jgi:AAA family ATP:ADP antiporter
VAVKQAILLFLRKTFDIRSGEVLRATLMLVNLFLIITTLLIVKPTVNGLFLSKFGVENLPYAFVLVAIAAVLVTSLYARLVNKVSLDKVIQRTLIFSVCSLIFFGFFLNFNYVESTILYIFYIWVSIFALVVTSQFWILANIVFNAREAKRIFGFVAAGGIAGGIFGGYFTSVLTQYTSSANLAYWAAFILSFCIPINYIITKNYPSEKYVSPKQKELNSLFGSHSINLIRSSKHLSYLALIVGVSVMVAKLVDYQFGGIASGLITDPDELTGFFGFWLSTFSLISLILQLFFTRKIIARYGVASSIIFLPGTISLGVIILSIFPGVLAAAVFLKMADGGLKQSINKAAMELLIMPIPTAIKNQTKIFIDVVVDSLATGISGIILLFLVKGMNLSTNAVNVMIVALLIFWFYLIKNVKAEYVISFRNAIDFPNQNKQSKQIDFNDDKVISGFNNVLVNGTEEEQFSILKLTRGHPNKELYKGLKMLLGESSSRVDVEIMKNLYYYENSTIFTEIEPFIHHENEDVRIAAFEYLVRFDKDQEGFIQKYLNQPNYKVRGAALVSLATESRKNFALAPKFKLIRQIQHNLDLLPSITDAEEYEFRKITTIKAISRGRIESLYSEILDSIKNKNENISKHAILESSKTLDHYFIVPLFQLLNDTHLNSIVEKALAHYGEEFIYEVEKLIRTSWVEAELIRHVPSIVKHIGSNKSVDLLFNLVDEDDFVIRQEAIRGLNHLKNNFAYLKFNNELIELGIAREAKLYLDVLCAMSGLMRNKRKWISNDEHEAEEARLGLIHILQKRLERNLERIFRFLGLNHSNSDIYNIYKGIKSNSSDVRYNALEFMDNIINSGIKNNLILIVESSFQDELCSDILDNLKIDIPSEYSSYQILLSINDTRIKLAVLYLISQCSTSEFHELINQQRSSEDLKIRDFAEGIYLKQFEN